MDRNLKGLWASQTLGSLGLGSGLWAYGVGLPSLRLHPAAARDTTDRSEVLIVSHVIWGADLATLSGKSLHAATHFGSPVPKQCTSRSTQPIATTAFNLNGLVVNYLQISGYRTSGISICTPWAR